MTKASPVPPVARPTVLALAGLVAIMIAFVAGLAHSDAARATAPGSACLTDPFGAATGYNEFVRENGQRGAESEGAIAYGGNLDANWMTVGTRLSVDKAFPSVVVNGSANGFNIQKGSAWLPNRTANSNFNGGGIYLSSAPIDFDAAFADLAGLSDSLVGQAANGSAAVVDVSGAPNPTGHPGLGGNALYLKGDDPNVNLFSVNPSQLTGNVAIMVEVPTGATAIVNVSGTDIRFDGQMWFRSGIGGSWVQAQDNATAGSNARTLWNLPDATGVKINTGSAFAGSVLAPGAEVQVVSAGHTIGQIFARGFRSGFETHLAPFVGCLPGSTPEPPKKPKLTITKEARDLGVSPPATGDPVVVKVGNAVGFDLSVKNNGDGPAENTVITDNVPAGLNITHVDPACTVTGQLVGCDAGTLAPGEGARFRITATTTLPAVPVASENEQLTIGKVEQHITLEAGETRTLTIGCDADGIMSDAAVRVDHIDQGTGNYGDIEIHRVRSTGKSTYEAAVTNHATGRAQLKLFGVCLPAATTSGSRLVVGNPLTETVTLSTGTHDLDLACPAGSTPVAPGIAVAGGRALVLASAPNGANGRKFTVKVEGSAVQVTAGIRCLENTTTTDGGPGSELIFTQVTKPITVGAGRVATESLICGDGAKGIVAGWKLDDGVVPLGNDPQPKSRVFKVWNPTAHTLNGTLYLLCLEARTGTPVPVNEKTYVNTATVTTTSAQEPGGTSSDSAAVRVIRDSGSGGNGPQGRKPAVLGARTGGPGLLVRVKVPAGKGRLVVRSGRRAKVGRKKIRRGAVIGKRRFRAGARAKAAKVVKVRLGRSARRAIRTGRLKRIRVAVRSGNRTGIRVLRVRR